MNPLDFVKTPKGNIAMITEVSLPTDNYPVIHCMIAFIGGGNPDGEKSGWWSEQDGLEIIDNLPSLLSRNMDHPFGTKHNVLIFPIK